MGIILTSTGLPLLTAAGLIAARATPAGAGGGVPLPAPRPEPGDFDGLQTATDRLAYRGVTITLSTALPYFWSANGDPVFVTTQASSITSFSPASTNASGTWANGAQLNPVDPETTTATGMDGSLTANLGGSTGIAYDLALNIDPGATRSAYRIAQGWSGSIVKSVRGTSGGFRTIEKYVVFTFMGAVPESDGVWFRPGYSGSTKTYPGKLPTNRNIVRPLTMPGGVLGCAAKLSFIQVNNLHTRPHWCYTGERKQRLQLTGEYDEYSADYAAKRALEVIALHDRTASDSDYFELLAILAQQGIDVVSAYEAGRFFGSGAGQNNGYLPYALLAGFALGDEATVVKCRSIDTNLAGQPFWVDKPRIGYGTRWPNSVHDKELSITYFDEDLNIPDWSHAGLGFLNSMFNAAYRKLNFDPFIGEFIAIGLLQNGPSGENGASALANGDFSTSNPMAAAIFYCDRLYTLHPVNSLSGDGDPLPTNTKAVYEAFRDEFTPARWHGRPDTPTPSEFPQFSRPAARNGAIDYDLGWAETGRGWSVSPITRYDVAYSIDGVQFVEQNNSGASGTIAGLRPGTQHYCRYRRHNRYGTSAWSDNNPEYDASAGYAAAWISPRNTVTTSGTASGTATNTVAPLVHRRKYPRWAGDYRYEPISGAAEDRDTTLYAGVGYWIGGTSFSPSYQWQRWNGSSWDNIGINNCAYTKTTGDLGAMLRCRVTVAGVTVNTNEVTIPVGEVFPTGVVLDTKFQHDWPYDWPAAVSGATVLDNSGNVSTLAHKPYYVWDGGHLDGGLICDKAGASPRMSLPLSAPTGVQINFSVKTAIGMHDNEPAQTGSDRYTALRFQRVGLGPQTDPATAGIWRGINLDNATYNGTVQEWTGDFTIPAGETVELFVWNRTNTGGLSGGDPALVEAFAWAVTAAPCQFQPDMWSVDGTKVTVSEMPRVNGARGTAFTDIEYRVNGGPWTSGGIRAAGSFAHGASSRDTIEIRAVSNNAAAGGNTQSPASTTKTVA